MATGRPHAVRMDRVGRRVTDSPRSDRRGEADHLAARAPSSALSARSTAFS
jgi:hypothetical protein